MRITSASIRPLLDSRKTQTLEVVLSNGRIEAKASTPHGKSTGSHEAVSLPFQKSLVAFDSIVYELYQQDFSSQEAFDLFLREKDGSDDKHVLGANTILALSMAFARLMAREQKKDLVDYLYNEFSSLSPLAKKKFPYIIANLVNGGSHGAFHPSWRAQFHVSPLSFQEFHIIPQVDDVSVSFGLIQEFFTKLRRELFELFGENHVRIGDEAGFSAPFDSYKKVLYLFSDLIEKYHYPCGIGIDVAASEFYKEGVYNVDGEEYSAEDLLAEYVDMIDSFPLLLLEDPFFEDDVASFAHLREKIRGKDVLIIGDDLTVTQEARVAMAQEAGAIDGCIIKPNQVGTIRETLSVVSHLYAHGQEAIVSHRSGETLDSFIADLAVSVGAWGIKIGAPASAERLAKYHRLVSLSEKES